MHTKAVSLHVRIMIRWHTLEQHTASYILPTARDKIINGLSWTAFTLQFCATQAQVVVASQLASV